MSDLTPAPWDYECEEDEFGDSRYYRIQGPTPKGLGTEFPYNVADTLNRHFCITPEEDRANARLIAAAPELLEAAREMLASMAWGPQMDRALAKLRTACDKAEGRQS